MTDAMVTPEAVLRFWFVETMPDAWFEKDDAFDAAISERFCATYEAAAAGAFTAWEETGEGALALVIVLDQFPRNMFRGSPKSYATDPQALAVAVRACERSLDNGLSAQQRQFLYLPLMHSEVKEDQERCVALFEPLAEMCPTMAKGLEAARKHRDIIARFGRFPHRNAVLGRTSTPEEEAFLAEPGSSF